MVSLIAAYMNGSLCKKNKKVCVRWSSGKGTTDQFIRVCEGCENVAGADESCCLLERALILNYVSL